MFTDWRNMFADWADMYADVYIFLAMCPQILYRRLGYPAVWDMFHSRQTDSKSLRFFDMTQAKDAKQPVAQRWDIGDTRKTRKNI